MHFGHNFMREKFTGILLSFIQLLLTIILLILLLIFKHITLYPYIVLVFVLFIAFTCTFLSQQSKVHRLIGRYISLGINFILLIAIVACFIF